MDPNISTRHIAIFYCASVLKGMNLELEAEFAVEIATAQNRKKLTEQLMKFEVLFDGMDRVLALNLCFQECVCRDYTELFDVLLGRKEVRPSAYNNKALHNSIKFDRLPFMRKMLATGRVDPSSDSNILIRKACDYNNVKIAKLLLSDQRVDPSVNNDYQLSMAIFHRNVDLISLIIADGRVDPSKFVATAIATGDIRIVEKVLLDRKTVAVDHEQLSVFILSNDMHMLGVLERWVHYKPNMGSGYLGLKAVEYDAYNSLRWLISCGIDVTNLKNLATELKRYWLLRIISSN